MTTVVTGASGHVGTNLVAALLGAGEDVRALVHRAPVADVPCVSGSILDPDSLTAAFEGASCVVHLAAKISITGDRDGSVWRTNVDGAGNVARAARLAGARLVHVSSVHAFDLASATGPIDESHAKSGDRAYAYDRSKAAGEERVQQEVARGLDAVILNPTGIVGPADPGPSRMGNVLLDLRARRLPALVRGGFDFVDVRDVVQAILAARTRGGPENHLIGGHHTSVKGIAQLASQATGVPPPRICIPSWLAAVGVPFAHLATRGEPTFTFESLGALRHGVPVDHRKATRILGHRPRPLEDTIADTYAWFDEEGT